MPTKAERLIELLEADMHDRGGLGDEWEAIDDEVKGEIRCEWAKLIGAVFNDAKETY